MPDLQLPYIPFRRKLILFAVILVAIIAIPVAFFAVQKPWNELKHQISISQAIIASVKESIPQDDLNKMNAFAAARIPETIEVSDKKRDYLDWTFNMILIDRRLLSKTEVLESLKENNIELHGGLDYKELQEAYGFWEKRFRTDPSALALFRKYKTYLIDVKRNTNGVVLDTADIYIMYDTGRKQGFFDKNTAFVLDGYPWYKSSFPGDIYTPPEGSNLRAKALTGATGFDHNTLSNPSRFFLPDYYTDQWGQWFSVWATAGTDGSYNSFIIDFDAGIVTRMMITVAITSGILGLIILAAIAFMTNWLSKRYSQSPVELSKGIRRVARQDYEYRVPELSDEFAEVGNEFNSMIEKLKERDRLQNALEKVLSKELAALAAKEGVMLGGQKATCTMMFTDFAGFSTITHKLDPHDIVDLLNEYFNRLIPVIKKYGGFPDKYIGDAIVAIFGAPIAFKDHAEKAVRCAIEMQKTMRRINDQRRKKGKIVFEMRIGLNTGDVLVGAIGCDMKLEYTSIGESTNLANRMESACSIGNIMMSSYTYSLLKPEFLEKYKIVLEKKKVSVKGYKDKIDSYEIKITPFTIEKNMETANIKDFYQYN
jgi:class 3 adenylate cyclase